jgi:hypothetical protein
MTGIGGSSEDGRGHDRYPKECKQRAEAVVAAAPASGEPPLDEP